jgi:hypothetical protein
MGKEESWTPSSWKGFMEREVRVAEGERVERERAREPVAK